MPKHGEDDEQKALFQWAAHVPELRWMHSIPNGGKRDKKEAGRLKAQGVKAGVWDVFLPLVRDGWPGLYIEMKYGKNKPTVNQIQFGEHIAKQGYKMAVCYTWTEAKVVIERYLKDKSF